MLWNGLIISIKISGPILLKCLGREISKPKNLWDMIWKNSVESGDPGIYNIDLANSYTNVSYFESLDSTNPCGEISLPSYGNCCLGNINLN
jgi:ribonucleoside-diphosphate reductase alpha chain